jgi:hypothetical protein
VAYLKVEYKGEKITVYRSRVEQGTSRTQIKPQSATPVYSVPQRDRRIYEEKEANKIKKNN